MSPHLSGGRYRDWARSKPADVILPELNSGLLDLRFYEFDQSGPRQRVRDDRRDGCDEMKPLWSRSKITRRTNTGCGGVAIVRKPGMTDISFESYWLERVDAESKHTCGAARLYEFDWDEEKRNFQSGAMRVVNGISRSRGPEVGSVLLERRAVAGNDYRGSSEHIGFYRRGAVSWRGVAL